MPLLNRVPRVALACAEAPVHWYRFKLDAARWVVPEAIADVEQLTPRLIAALVVRYIPLRAMAWFRLGTLANSIGARGVPSYVQRRLIRKYGLELPPGVPTGGGLYIAHPVGCVLFTSSIGENVTVIGQVTFGTADDAKWPVIGDRTFFGVGSRVLGGLTIGHDARVGANAVVLRDVPAGATAVGIPARVLDRKQE